MPYIQKLKITKTSDLSIISMAKGYSFSQSVGLLQTFTADEVSACADLKAAFDCGALQVYSNWSMLDDADEDDIGGKQILQYKSFIGKDPNNRCLHWDEGTIIIQAFLKIEDAKRSGTPLDEDAILDYMRDYVKAVKTRKAATVQAQTAATATTSSKTNNAMPHGMTLSDYKKSVWGSFTAGPIEPYFKLKIPQTQRNDLVKARMRYCDVFKDADYVLSRRIFDASLRIGQQYGWFGTRRYLIGVFELTDHPMKDIIIPKLDGDEFKNALFDLLSTFGLNATPINKRLKLYYGDPSGGKTYQAVSELTNKEYVYPCSSDVTPDVLMREFDFQSGEAEFHDTLLTQALKLGYKIVFEEIRLLPQVSLCFLQNLLDNKDCIWYNNQKIDIHPGFEIIGTMNLKVNGHINPLPEALVDRAYDIRRFDITDDCYDVSYDFE